MNMAEKVITLVPEIIMLAVAFMVMIIGLSPSAAVRRSTMWLSAFGLVFAGVVVGFGESMGLPALPPIALFLKLAIVGVGLLLLLAAAETPDDYGGDTAPGKLFDVTTVSRGEFYGFFLLSLVGAMLCVTADDLIWLFLALELTSLPTYVMVATAREKIEAPEAGVKYFFLGAFAAAIFLYGFALLYGATGHTTFTPLGGEQLLGITQSIAEGGLSTLGLIGLLLAIGGLAFKIAAVPMHTYAADVYQGAATPVTAFLAFVPKTAGFVSLIAVLSLVGWTWQPLSGPYGQAIVWLLWIMAVATMYVGNTLALRQTNVKRVLAYSSIAHTGYMLVGLIAARGAAERGEAANGLAAVLFYLVAYGVMNLGAFAVLGILKSRGEEAETYDDLKGLYKRHPGLAAIMAVCIFSLTGIPPILGFWGKLYLVGAAVSASYIWLAVLLVLASAIGAVYYLRIIGACFLPQPTGQTHAAIRPWRSMAAMASFIAVIGLSIAAGWLFDQADRAADVPAPRTPSSTVQSADGPIATLR